MKKFLKYSPLIVSIVVVALLGGYLVNNQLSSQDTSASSNPPLTVSGNKIMRGGKPFVPKGVIITGLLAHKKVRGEGNHLERLYEARDRFDHSIFLTIKQQWRANTVRFNINQGGLDPRSTNYDPSYLKRIEGAANAANDQDLVVIIALFNGIGEEGTTFKPLPTTQTSRAWRELVPVFKNNPNVILEVFNEPGLFEIESNWVLWRDGGRVPTRISTPTVDGYPAHRAVGHQDLVTEIRELGAKNLLIVDGLFYSRSLNEKYVLNDPLNRLAYAVHPFFGNDMVRDEAPNTWDQRFGNFAKKYPVVATAWSSHNLYDRACRVNAPQLTREFFTYVSQRQIGVIGWAFDIPGTIVADWDYRPSNFKNFSCDTRQTGGGGVFLRRYLRGDPVSNNLGAVD